jgi:Fe-S cluster biogenesis protein NfuA
MSMPVVDGICEMQHVKCHGCSNSNLSCQNSISFMLRDIFSLSTVLNIIKRYPTVPTFVYKG